MCSASPGFTSGLSKAKQSVPLQKLPLEDCSLLRFEATLNEEH